jgi:hypothetical protein
MQEMIYVKFFVDDLVAMEELNYEEKGRLFEAMLMYAQTGKKPQLKGNERFLFPAMRARIDRDKEGVAGRRNLSRSEAGKKGAAARWNKEEKAEESETDGKIDGKNGKDGNCHLPLAKMAITIDNRLIDNRQETIEGETITRAREEFSPPTEKDVEEFCREQGITVNAKRFVSFYASKGWMIGSTPMQDWKAAVLAWAAKDEEKVDNKPKLLKSYDISEIEQLFADDLAEISRGAGNDLQRTG